MRLNRELMFLALGGALSCSSYPTTKVVPIDCNAEAPYDVLMLDNFDTLGMSPFWTAGDTVANVADVIQPITDGDRCGSTAALVMHSTHNNDWGSIFGYNTFGGPRDASAWEGIAFWARAPGSTTKGFTILLDDPNTSDPTPPPNNTNPNDSNCLTTQNVDGGQAVTCIDPMTGQMMPCGTTTAPPPNACGNGYSTMLVVTTDWRFYTIPFRTFQQSPMPNQVPNALLTMVGSVPGTTLLTNQLLNLTLRMQREATMELWLDNLSFYRPKAAVTTDAGS